MAVPLDSKTSFVWKSPSFTHGHKKNENFPLFARVWTRNPKISVFDTEWGRGLDEQISGCSFLTRAVKPCSLPSIDTARDVLQARAAQNDFFPPLEPPEGTWAAHGQSALFCSLNFASPKATVC